VSRVALRSPSNSVLRDGASRDRRGSQPYSGGVQVCRSRNRQAADRAARIRLLNGELEQLRATALERTRQTETKASFIVVAAGVLASATGIELITTDTWLIGLAPFGLTIATVLVSTAALWPRTLQVPSARSIVDRWVDADTTPTDLDDYLLEVKAVEVELRDQQNEIRMKWAKRGFGLLLASLLATMVVATTNAVAPVWSDHVQGQTESPTPAPPESTSAS